LTETVTVIASVIRFKAVGIDTEAHRENRRERKMQKERSPMTTTRYRIEVSGGEG
jgi:hypothetical protein